MRILDKNLSLNEIKVLPETDDDIWHLYNVVEPGDLVTASTVRRDEKATDKIRAERAAKKRMTLGVRVEKIEYGGEALRMRLLGTIEEGQQDIGQYHSLVVEPGRPLAIRKEHWKITQQDRIERAVKETVKPRILFVSMDQDEATLAALRAYGLKELAEIRANRPGKYYEDGGKQTDYFGEIIEKLKSTADRDMPIVLIGPGYAKEVLADRIKSLTDKPFGKVYVQHTGQSGMVGVNNLLKSGLGADILRDSSVGTEAEAVENLKTCIAKDGLCTYGPGEVSAAADAGAVELLLVTDTFLRERDFDGVIRSVEGCGGKVITVSDGHDAGKELAALGGVAAMLRYKTEQRN